MTPTPGNAGRLDLYAPSEGVNVVVDTAVVTCLLNLGCSVDNKDAVIDPDAENFATANLAISVLGLALEALTQQEAMTITVEFPEPIQPAIPLLNHEGFWVEPNSPGFVISFPDPNLVTLSALPEVRIYALDDEDNVLNMEAYPWGLLDLIGLGVVGLTDINNAQVYLSTSALVPYSKIRIAFAQALADVFLNINVHQTGLAGVAGSISGDSRNPVPETGAE